jgi:hypothetical protein
MPFGANPIQMNALCLTGDCAFGDARQAGMRHPWPIYPSRLRPTLPGSM